MGMTMQNKLLPCPFCCGMAKVDSRLREWNRQLYVATFVKCEVCGASSKEVWDIHNKDGNEREKEVVEKWNTRKPMERILKQLEEIYDHCDKCKKENYEEQNWEEFDMFSNRNEGIYMAIEIVKGGVDNAE